MLSTLSACVQAELTSPVGSPADAGGGQEVGKVSKTAPVLISKCLELLIQDLVKSASKVCKSKGAATVNVNHLREAVAKESTFDFLQEVRQSTCFWARVSRQTLPVSGVLWGRQRWWADMRSGAGGRQVRARCRE